MMRKVFILFSAFLLLLFSPVLNTIFAQEDIMETPSATPSPSPSSIVDYYLAYPGILSDHPLYKLKVLRDRISLALINDPKKKIELYLLQTDKGILAAAMLVDKNKSALAKETALKAEHKYTLLTYELSNLPRKPDAEFFNKLKTASLKHQEVITSLIERVSKEDQVVFRQVVDFSKRNWETVEKYRTTRFSRF